MSGGRSDQVAALRAELCARAWRRGPSSGPPPRPTATGRVAVYAHCKVGEHEVWGAGVELDATTAALPRGQRGGGPVGLGCSQYMPLRVHVRPIFVELR